MALQLFMGLQKQMEVQQLPWKKVELNDAAFRVAAQIPMQWLGPGRRENSFFFDIENFVRRVGEA
jgi:hypothetical protein